MHRFYALVEYINTFSDESSVSVGYTTKNCKKYLKKEHKN
jgi:hypothetical protein